MKVKTTTFGLCLLVAIGLITVLALKSYLLTASYIMVIIFYSLFFISLN